MATESFFKRFRGLIRLAVLSGIYIPGAEKLFPFQSRGLIFAYLVYFYTAGWFNFLDSVILLCRYDLPYSILFQLVSSIGLLCWVFLTSMFMLTQRKNLNELVHLWDEELQPELFKHKREVILNTQTKLVWRKIYVYFTLQICPVLAFYLHAICVGQLVLPSNLGNDIQRETSPLRVLPQVLGFLPWISTYLLFQCVFTLFLRLILAELEYVKFALKEIFSEVKVNPDGNFFGIFNDGENRDLAYKSSCKKLSSVIKHHINVLKFSNIVKKVYSPIVFFEFFTLSTFLCCLIYCATEGYVDVDIAILVIVNMGLYCFMTSLHCAIGDSIRNLSFDLGDAAFYGNWMAYPISLQKSMIMIIRIAYERPIMIKPFGLFPLLLNTFRKMTFQQYRFFRCLADMKR